MCDRSNLRMDRKTLSALIGRPTSQSPNNGSAEPTIQPGRKNSNNASVKTTVVELKETKPADKTKLLTNPPTAYQKRSHPYIQGENGPSLLVSYWFVLGWQLLANGQHCTALLLVGRRSTGNGNFLLLGNLRVRTDFGEPIRQHRRPLR